MTIQKITLSVVVLAFASLFLLSCGNTGSADNAVNADTAPKSSVKTEKPQTKADADISPEDRPEFASAYICPMHCKGSGSDAAGKCPVCGMDYVANDKVKGGADGHKGHDHGAHDGHDHGSHEGHNH